VRSEPALVWPDAVEVRACELVSPSGFWIDGVTIAEAVAMIRELG
jgi:hypothetical protein